MISATDPVTTISIFSRLRVPTNLFNLVFGESIVNDAVAIVFSRVFASLARDDNRNVSVIATHALYQFTLIAVGSVVLGIAVALVASLVTKYFNWRHHLQLELGLLLLFGYLSYQITEYFKLSGIMAVLFCGITMDHYALFNISAETFYSFKMTLSTLHEISEAFVFVYIGMAAVIFPRHNFQTSTIITLLLFSILGRIVSVLPLAACLNVCRKSRITGREQVIMCLAGLRGAVAFGNTHASCNSQKSNKYRIRTF